MKKINLPPEVCDVISKLHRANFNAYIVGGCVRDILLHRKPKDWDVTTNAKPEEIIQLFPDSIYENNWGTIRVKTESEDPSLKIIEVTTFRKEGKYTDKRHPDTITFASTLEEDLSRRDFTINAIALDIKNQKYIFIDPFLGKEDIRKKIIRTVGDPDKRFQEDALRLMRAVRFACELNFQIEPRTLQAISRNAHLLRFIAKERIRDEFIKIINTPEAARGILLLQKTNLLHEFIPELEEGIGVTQNKHHIYTVWEHSWRALDYAAKKNYNLAIRLAALFHDIGKPRTKQGEGKESTFYGHEIVGTKMTAAILHRLKFPKQFTDKVIKLVRHHYFVYDPEITTDSSVRRLIMKVGKENIFDLAKLREADRIGSGCPKAVPFRLRHFLFRVEKILQEMSGAQPSLKMLAINGNDVMKILNIPPGPKVGIILNILLGEVLEDLSKNNKEYLQQRIKELGKLPLLELQKFSHKAEKKYRQLLLQEEEKIKKKYHV